jgi:hypothetical protein
MSENARSGDRFDRQPGQQALSRAYPDFPFVEAMKREEVAGGRGKSGVKFFGAEKLFVSEVCHFGILTDSLDSPN